ncbi:MAG TPA: hypothetical protein VFZ83_00095 [Acidimicrobiia bacterium]|nr:hypothetical protein [Acidimicrobiia bacterium]
MTDAAVSPAAQAVICAIRDATRPLVDAIACANAAGLGLDDVRGALDELWDLRAIDYAIDDAGNRRLVLRSPAGTALGARCR